MHIISQVLLGVGCLLFFIHGQRRFDPIVPPWQDFDNSVRVRTYYGDVNGFSVPWHIDDEYWNPEWDEKPNWFTRRINCFLGVPYAKPPTGFLRFQRPMRPRWGGIWDASFYRPACPQELDEIRQDIPTFPAMNVSEDCLYMNIFAPNLTDHSAETRYPVVVFFHGGDFLTGTSQQYPGHVLATEMLVVVTFNYRLGALGFLTTEDASAPGNWGLFDQHLALEFVKENIRAFRGDPQQITIMGDGSGAASVGLHMISPMSMGKNFFHKCIMMSGSDLDRNAIVYPFWRPREYAAELAERLGCSTEDSYVMMNCLRNNRTIPWQLILSTQSKIKANDGDLGIVWGPIQDGGFREILYQSFLPAIPLNRRHGDMFDKVPCIMGLNTNDGAKVANRSVSGLGSGMQRNTFRNFITKMLLDWRISDLYRERAIESLEFQYTHWANPENKTARTQEFIYMLTDLLIGTGIDEVAKLQCEYEDVFMYDFDYKSWNNYLPAWMGPSHSAIVPYVFGVPFMNETILNETEIVPRQWYDYDDRNISDFTMYMWSNFIKYGIPTPNITRNITWEPFNPYNLTYLNIDERSYLWFRYRQPRYGFWREYFPTIAKQDYYVPTATPTPAGREYYHATWSLMTVVIVLFVIVGVCIYLLILQSQREEYREKYTESEMPLDLTGSRSQISMSRTPRGTPSEGGYPEPPSAFPAVSYPADEYRARKYPSSRGYPEEELMDISSRKHTASRLSGSGAMGFPIEMDDDDTPMSSKPKRPALGPSKSMEVLAPKEYSVPEDYRARRYPRSQAPMSRSMEFVEYPPSHGARGYPEDVRDRRYPRSRMPTNEYEGYPSDPDDYRARRYPGSSSYSTGGYSGKDYYDESQA